MKKIIAAITLLISSLACASDTLVDSAALTTVAPLSKKDSINLFSSTGMCEQCDLSNQDLRKTIKAVKDSFLEIDLEGSNISLSDLSSIKDLNSLIIINSNLSASNLKNSNLKYSNLSDANLAGSDLSGADLTGANLSRTNLTAANLTNAILTGANLTGANLTFADLTSATLYQANFTQANLTNSIFNKSKLKTTVFTNAITTGASFGTVITGANSKEAINLSVEAGA